MTENKKEEILTVARTIGQFNRASLVFTVCSQVLVSSISDKNVREDGNVLLKDELQPSQSLYDQYVPGTELFTSGLNIFYFLIKIHCDW